jgi:hypothetical protein
MLEHAMSTKNGNSTIAIIDYGMGNLRSVQKAFEKVGHPAVVTSGRGHQRSGGRGQGG